MRFGFPKGSLQKSTEELFARAGLPVKVKDRNYFPTVEDDGLSLRPSDRRRFSLRRGRRTRRRHLRARLIVETARRRRGCRASTQGDVQPREMGRGGPRDSPVETAATSRNALPSEPVHTTERFFLDRGIQGVKVEYSLKDGGEGASRRRRHRRHHRDRQLPPRQQAPRGRRFPNRPPA